jgi:Ca2+-binding EF-hand superfamily protein
MAARLVPYCLLTGCLATLLEADTGEDVARSADESGYKLLVFAAETPVIVGLQVEFEPGATIATNRQTYARRWFQRLDRNADDVLSEEESRRVPSFGRFEDVSGEMDEEWTRLDTAPRDGRLSNDELLDHINQAMGSGLSIKRPRRSASQTVILHPRLDTDDDGQVSTEELESGLVSLGPYDFDDDESLSAAELQPFPRAMRAAAAEDILDVGEAPFVALDDDVDTETLLRRLLAQYDHLTGKTAAALLSAPEPDVTITLHFPRQRLKRLDAGNVRRPEAVVVKEESTRRRLATSMGGLNVDARLQDARGSFERITTLFRERQFGFADRDGDQQLNPAEFGRMEIEDITFSAVDAEQDQQVTKQEFLDFVDLRALLAQCRLEMTVANETTSLFDALDVDEDLRLSPREFAQGAESLLSLDRNGNGQLAEAELVTKYMLEFAVTRPPDFDDLVGSVGFTEMSDETRLPILRPVTRGPEWFRKMDRNQDGDVTWREFLGPREAFDRLDSDRDGRIDDTEAEQST